MTKLPITSTHHPIIINRHQSAIEWLERKYKLDTDKIPQLKHIKNKEELSMLLEEYNLFIGVLPSHLIALICENSASFWGIVTEDIPADQRGKNLNYQQMLDYNTTINEYNITITPLKPNNIKGQ